MAKKTFSSSAPAAPKSDAGGSAAPERPAGNSAGASARRYGWRRDPLDHRDNFFSLPETLLPALLPAVVDLRPFCPPIYDQGELGSCTANAIAAAFRFEQRKQQLYDLAPSRLFIYYNERAAEGTIEDDAGANIRDGIKSLRRIGVCDEALWPYDISQFAARPSAAAFAAAKAHNALAYRRLMPSRRILCGSLAAGLPFVFGFNVYESFESDAVARTGLMPMPGPNEQLLGGHAVLAVGYDTNRQIYIVQNSWGPAWGDGGYFYMPMGYLENGALADDRWVISKVEGGPALIEKNR